MIGRQVRKPSVQPNDLNGARGLIGVVIWVILIAAIVLILAGCATGGWTKLSHQAVERMAVESAKDGGSTTCPTPVGLNPELIREWSGINLRCEAIQGLSGGTR